VWIVHEALGEILNEDMTKLRDIWESTSFHLERRQANPNCVKQEEAVLSKRKSPPYQLSFTPLHLYSPINLKLPLLLEKKEVMVTVKWLVLFMQLALSPGI